MTAFSWVHAGLGAAISAGIALLLLNVADYWRRTER